MTVSNGSESPDITGEDLRWLESSGKWRRLLPIAAFVLAAVGIVNVALALWAGLAHDFPPGQLLRDALVGTRWDAQYTGGGARYGIPMAWRIGADAGLRRLGGRKLRSRAS